MPKIGWKPQNRAEGLSGGAAKRCYGKSCRKIFSSSVLKKMWLLPSLRILHGAQRSTSSTTDNIDYSTSTLIKF